MTLLKYILLGLIQGITEPLPISSSGHIFILKHIFNTNIFNDLNFEIFLNFASFIAIFIIFYQDIIKLIKGFFKYIFDKSNKDKYYNEFKYCIMIIIGSIPVGIAGILLKDAIETFLNKIWIVGITFIITGVCLIIVKNINGKKKDTDIGYKEAIIIGLFQMIALLPGLSRSGMTLVGCLLMRLNRESSLKYTFMLYMPVSVATFILGVKDVIDVGISNNMLIYYIIGMIMSGVFTLLTYKVFSEYVKRGKLWKFSIYLFIVGIVVFLLYLI